MLLDTILPDRRYHNAAVPACGVLALVRASAPPVLEPIVTAGDIAHVYRWTVGVLQIFVLIEALLRVVIFRTARKVAHEPQIATVRVRFTFVRTEILLRAVIFRTARKVTRETQIATVRVLCTFVRIEVLLRAVIFRAARKVAHPT